jgi:hypothetical protein
MFSNEEYVGFSTPKQLFISIFQLFRVFLDILSI